MQTKQFPSHGGLHLATDGQLLLIDAVGPVNLEMLLQYQRDVGAHREALMAQGPWGSLMTWKGTALLPAEAQDMTIDFIKKAMTMNLVATCVVLSDAEYPEMAEAYWHGIYQKSGICYRVCHDQLEAREWLHQQLKKYPPQKNKNQ